MRRVLPAFALAALLALTACTSDGDGQSPSPTASASTAANQATVVSGLAAKVRQAVGALTSAHFDIDGSFSGQDFTGSGDQKLSSGTLAGLSADLKLSVGTASLVVVGDKRYVKLPPSLAGPKPWLPVTPDSSNLIVKQLGGFLDTALTIGNVGNLGEVVAASKSVKAAGAGVVAGVRVTKYALVVDPTKLPGLSGTVTDDVPVELALDNDNRPVQILTSPTVSGSTGHADATFGKFDEPVTVTAPPAGQIQN